MLVGHLSIFFREVSVPVLSEVSHWGVGLLVVSTLP